MKDLNRTEGAMVVFNQQVWKKLKEKGYQYLQVEALTGDGRTDHIISSYFLLTPYRSLPENPYLMEIYEKIDSPILERWAASGDETLLVRRKFV